MDIYLAGSPLDKLFGEVSCGDVGIEGVKVIVPLDRFETVMTRIESFDTTKWYNKSAVHRFLSYRCGREFLERFIDRHPQFIPGLRVGAYLSAVSDVDVILRLREFDLLPETERVRAVGTIRILATTVPDSGFLRAEIRGLLTPEELASILEQVRTTLLPELDAELDQWRSNYNGKDDPEDHFSDLKSALKEYRAEFLEDKEAAEQIDAALVEIDNVIEELRSGLPEEPDRDDFYGGTTQESEGSSVRSIFDDVDH
jgi:hypothetical protein